MPNDDEYLAQYYAYRPIRPIRDSVYANVYGSHIAPSSNTLTASPSNKSSAHPLDRYVQNRDGPFVAFRPYPGQNPSFPSQNDERNFSQTQYRARTSTLSEPESLQTSAQLPSDSGYGTHEFSIASGDLARTYPDCSEIVENFQSFAPFDGSELVPQVPEPKLFACFECPKSFRLASELRKHSLRHSKPIRCARCSRGFPSANDRDRHEKCRHDLLREDCTIYMCAAGQCSKRRHHFYRLDNYKAHLKNVHEFEDHRKLIEMSTYHRKQNYFPADKLDTRKDPLEDTWPRESPTSRPPLSEDDLLRPRPEQQHISSWAQNDQASLLSNVADNQILVNPGPAREPSAVLEHQPPDMTSSNPGQQRGDAAQVKSTQAKGTIRHLPQTSTTRSNNSKASQEPQISQPPEQVVVHHQEPAQRKAMIAGIMDVIKGYIGDAPLQKEGALLEMLEHVLPTDNLCLATGSKDTRPPAAKDPSSQVGGTDIQRETVKADDVPMVLDEPEVVEDARRGGESVKPTSDGEKPKNRSATPFSCPFAGCKFTRERYSQMKKHIRRHERCYGCTFPDCNKRFGSKSDWKRHESSQHYQLDQWRCQFIVTDSKDGTASGPKRPHNVCALRFHTQGQLKTHLEKKHSVLDDKAKAEWCEQGLIGVNGQGSYWCGFCKEIVRLKTKGIKAWESRFSHIAKHFITEGREIDDWLLSRGTKTKGELKDGPHCQDVDDSNSSSDEADDDDTSHQCDPMYKAPQLTRKRNVAAVVDEETAAEEAPPHKQQKLRTNVGAKDIEAYAVCCQCHEGLISELRGSCDLCEHTWCSGCCIRQCQDSAT